MLGLYWGYLGIMEKQMEITTEGLDRLREKKMETTIMGLYELRTEFRLGGLIADYIGFWGTY